MNVSVVNNPSRANECRMNKMLWNASTSIKNQFIWDEEGLWSFTHLKIGHECAQYLAGLIGRAGTVSDLMGGIGGNAIAFSQVFNHVNTIELNEERRDMITHNAALFTNSQNINIYGGYYQDIIGRLRQDAIFFDPPWGSDYKRAKHLRIKIHGPDGSSIEIERAICALRNHAKYIMVKLPLNYDMEHFDNGICNAANIVAEWEYRRPNSMRIIVMKYMSV